MFPYIIFSITIFILLYFLYKNINSNLLEYYSSNIIEQFTDDIDFFNSNTEISKVNLNRKFETTLQSYRKNLNSKFVGYDQKFYRYPLKNGSRKIDEITDEGVLKNFRTRAFNNTYSNEIDYNSLLKILNTIEKLGEFNININYEEFNKINKEKIHKSIIRFLINKINFYLKKLDLEVYYHKFDDRKFKYFDHNIIQDEPIEGLTSDNRNLVLIFIMYRKNKDYHYSIYVNCAYNYIFSKINFTELIIQGMIEEEKITFNDYVKPKIKFCNNEDRNSDEACFPLINPSNKSITEYDKYFKEKLVSKFLSDKELEAKKHIDYKKYKCFLKDGFNESTCKSYDKEKKTYGVWDKPCENDYECPFYKENKNYSNDRGKCINGYCEMPTNVERAGYKYYFSDKKPFCHNCNIKDCLGEECFTCCEEQKDRNKYPNLKSPDYMFKNDNR